MNVLKILLAEAEAGSPGRMAHWKAYLMMLQVALSVRSHVPDLILCVFQLLLHKFEFLVHTEAHQTFHANAGLGFTPAS